MTARPKKIIAIIPARGGSKRLPDKNIRNFSGRPLLTHTIALARQCRSIDRVVVDTDSPRIAAIARRAGAEVPCLRPAHLATNTSLMIDTILHTLDRLVKADRYRPDYLMLLEPNAPLATLDDLNRCIALMKKNKARSVVTVAPTQPLLFNLKSNGAMRLANTIKLTSTNAQQLPAGYLLTGSVFLIEIATLRRLKKFFTPETKAVIIPRWRAIDIDTPEDLALAELIYKNRTLLAQNIKRISHEKR